MVCRSVHVWSVGPRGDVASLEGPRLANVHGRPLLILRVDTVLGIRVLNLQQRRQIHSDGQKLDVGEEFPGLGDGIQTHDDLEGFGHEGGEHEARTVAEADRLGDENGLE